MLRQSLQHKLLQKLSPQQIQLMKLLQVPTIALEQRIKEELEENPALDEGKEELEEDLQEADEAEETNTDEDFDISDYLQDDETPDYKLSINNHGAETEDTDIPVGSGVTFRDLLNTQLGLKNISEEQKQLAEHVIGNLDDSGYLRRELPAIVNDLAFSQNVMTTKEALEDILRIIQSFDPPGVGARDLRECLLIQLQRKSRNSLELKVAEEVLGKYFEEFTKKHYDKILKRMEIDDEVLKSAIEEIVKLNPKPGNTSKETAKSIAAVVPDFMLSADDDELKINLNQRNAPDLKVSRSYNEMLKGYAATNGKPDKKQKEAIQFVKQKIDSAKWFIDAIKQRQQTLLFTMNAIAEFQKEYFLTGDETKLKPMILKDIAGIVHMDISTVSRVANSKYVQTPYGTFLLKSFFSESLSTDSGEEVSTREVKKILQEAVDDEDKKKPLTDEKLCQVLKDKGYNIARRTVAKYREQLNISVARLRKEL